MPTGYLLQENLLELAFEGRFTTTDALSALDQGVAATTPGSRPNVLIDVTRSRELQELGELRELARGFAEQSDALGRRVAVLVVEPVRYGIARQLGALLDQHGFESRAFRDRDEALTWLGGEG